MRINPSILKKILTAIGVIIIISIVLGGCMFFSGKDPSPTDPATTDPTGQSTAPADDGQINFKLTGYLFNSDRELIEQTSFTAKGPALEDISNGDSAPFDLVHVAGFPDIVSVDNCSGRLKERNNGVQEIIVDKTIQRRNYETGKLIGQYSEVQYSIFIDSATSEFLMCIIKVDNTDFTFYFAKSASTISDVLTRAYQE